MIHGILNIKFSQFRLLLLLQFITVVVKINFNVLNGLSELDVIDEVLYVSVELLTVTTFCILFFTYIMRDCHHRCSFLLFWFSGNCRC
jgi:hypothetical protein